MHSTLELPQYSPHNPILNAEFLDSTTSCLELFEAPFEISHCDESLFLTPLNLPSTSIYHKPLVKKRVHNRMDRKKLHSRLPPSPSLSSSSSYDRSSSSQQYAEDLPRSLRNAPLELRPAIRRRQNSESARRCRERKREEEKQIEQRFRNQESRLSSLEQKLDCLTNELRGLSTSNSTTSASISSPYYHQQLQSPSQLPPVTGSADVHIPYFVDGEPFWHLLSSHGTWKQESFGCFSLVAWQEKRWNMIMHPLYFISMIYFMCGFLFEK